MHGRKQSPQKSPPNSWPLTTSDLRTYAGDLINCCVLSLFVAPPGAGPGAGEGGAGPGPRAPGPYEIVPGPRAPVAGPVGDPRSGRRSSRPRSGRGRTCESRANIFSSYVNAVLPKGWAGEPPISKTRSWRIYVRERMGGGISRLRVQAAALGEVLLTDTFVDWQFGQSPRAKGAGGRSRW